MYMTLQYLTVSCIPAIGYVPNICKYNTTMVADILWCVRYLKFILDYSWHFTAVRYTWHWSLIAGISWYCIDTYIISMYKLLFSLQKFLVANWILLSLHCMVRPLWFQSLHIGCYGSHRKLWPQIGSYGLRQESWSNYRRSGNFRAFNFCRLTVPQWSAYTCIRVL